MNRSVISIAKPSARAFSLARLSLGLIFTLLVVASCAVKPTATHDNPERKMRPVPEAAILKLQTGTVVLDVRSPFEFSTGHVPKSYNIAWDQFSERDPAQHGSLQGDAFAIARKLARMGITPLTNVVVVGKGLSGNGEEGRVAWMLQYLGVKDVRFGSLAAFKGHLTANDVTDLDQSVPIWKPEISEGLLVPRAEFQAALNHHASVTPMAFRPDQKPQIYRILDVRDEKDYLGKEGFGAAHAVPNFDAINIPWKQFFDPLLRPNYELLPQLKAVGITPDQRLIVIGVEGVTSAAVTMALRAMGYDFAGNEAGGLKDLMSAYPAP